MINTPSEGIVLNVEQQNQVNVLERRLHNLREEITVAKKELVELRDECEKINKERDYRAELLESVTEKTAQGEKDLAILLASTKDAQTSLEKLFEQDKKTRDYHKMKEDELGGRETKLSLAEDEHDKKYTQLHQNIDKLIEDQKLVRAARDTLAKAIEQSGI